ncbi:MAG: class I SAM-dependent RNA methyltransferase [Bacteroidales bacterium]|jgi:putative N6-adenine-specific DNA methylase
MKFTAKTLYGLENILVRELEDIGAHDIKSANRAVTFSGGKEILYKANYCSRIALSILVPIAGFRIKSKDDLYRKTSEIEWSRIMDDNCAFSVVPVVKSRIFDHSGYPALVVKDAVADYFRKRTGRRPSVDTRDPGIVINLHISNDIVDVSLDSSVTPLYKRGYRVRQGPAPLNEVLAAGMLMLSGWDGKQPLYDPMCGSGTILIEAGLIAGKVPPGRYRKHFGFTRWKDFDSDLFSKVRAEADSGICQSPALVSGSDISEAAAETANENIREAGLSGKISVIVKDFRETKPSSENGWLVFNPPYGKRLNPGDMEKLYSMIGTTLKHNYPGHNAWLITSDREYLKFVGLKPQKKFTLYNGEIECLFAGYELYEGTKKHPESMKSS